MNGKVFVGKKTLSLTEYKKTDPITGVILWVDDNNCYQAGNDTGTVIENDCPYGTQEMANTLLQQLSGYEYQGIEANGAIVAPIAELGDGLTINGIYTQLAYQNIRFSTGEVMDVAAPGKNETLHEYQTEGETSKWFSHQIAETRSQITKTSEEIMLEVENEIEGLSASITIQLDSITSQITGLNGQVSSISQKVNNITLSVSNYTDRSYIDLSVGGIVVSSQTIRFTGDVVFESDLSDGTTLISGDCIRTGEITANYIHLGGQMEVYRTATGNTFGGYIGYMSGMSASGSSTAGIALASSNEAAVVICTTGGVRMGYNGVSTVVCTSTQVSIRGDSVFINGTEQVSSDGRIKTEKRYDVDDYLSVFDKLKPCTFVYEGHTRRHMGLIAQEVQETVTEEGIDEKNFAAICTIPESEDFPDGLYTLRYGEIQIMTIAKVQQLNRRLSELEAKING